MAATFDPKGNLYCCGFKVRPNYVSYCDICGKEYKAKDVVEARNLAAMQKPEIATPRKENWPEEADPIRCLNGPFAGETLWLTSPMTLPFTVRGQTGKYVRGWWVNVRKEIVNAVSAAQSITSGA